MRLKVLLSLCVLTSLLGYLEWGAGQHELLLTLEWKVLKKLFEDPGSVLHPFVLLPLAGQCMLLIAVFQRKPSRILSFLGIGCLALLLLLIFAIGIMTGNMKILGSAVPFMVVAGMTVWHLRRGWAAEFSDAPSGH